MTTLHNDKQSSHCEYSYQSQIQCMSPNCASDHKIFFHKIIELKNFNLSDIMQYAMPHARILHSKSSVLINSNVS